MMMFAAFIALAGRRRMLAAAAASLMLLSSQATPQPNSGTSKGGQPNALQGFSQNRNQPVQIEAASLEVRDKDKIATFSGSVKVVQGDTIMRCKSLVVYYEQQGQQGGGQAMKAATPGPGGSSSISKLEALGGVTVNQKDQTATGDNGPVRHEVEHRHASGQRRRQPGPERDARRPAGGRSHQRRVARRIRQGTGQDADSAGRLG